MKNTEIFKRLTSESPSFFKKITRACMALGAVGTAIVAIPASVVALPAAVITIGGYLVAIGIVGAAISKSTVADPEVLKKDDNA